MKRPRSLRTQPDPTFDKNRRSTKPPAGAHGVKSKEINSQTYAAGTRALGGGQGPGIEG